MDAETRKDTLLTLSMAADTRTSFGQMQSCSFESGTAPTIKRHKKVHCKICFKAISKKNIRQHFRLHQPKNVRTAICVDKHNGIFLVEPSSVSGYPIHVKVKTVGELVLQCSSKECIPMTGPATRGQQPYTCEHVLTALNMSNAVKAEELTHLEDSTMSQQMRKSISELHQLAIRNGCEMVVKYPAGTTMEHFSVYTGFTSHWSPFGRTLVTLRDDQLICMCSGSKYNCCHKGVVRWALRVPEPAEKRIEAEEPGQLDEYQTDGDIFDIRKLPMIEDEHFISVDPSTADLSKLAPKENMCDHCGFVLQTELLTRNAKIADISFVKEDVMVYAKRCVPCCKRFPYLGLDDGLLNYNNKTIITLRFCKWLRCSLENHIALATEIGRLTAYNEIAYPKCNDIMKAYLRFEIMSRHDYNFCCIECGQYPPVIVTDVNKKCCFRLKVDDVDGDQKCSGAVSQTEFWDAVEKDILQPEKSPVVKPSYDFWAPYVGKASVSGDLTNTEYCKVPTCNIEDIEDDQPLILNEDLLLELMTEKKLKDIKSVCRSLHISDSGRKMDCLQRLREKLVNRDMCNKVFTKLVGSSGGLLCACCPHGIVYAMKFLLRGESPRDHVDLLRAFKCQPTLHICDVPSFVSRHGNKRYPGMFEPNGGRFVEPTMENVLKVTEGKLQISIPELSTNNLLLVSSPDGEHSYSKPFHPLTKTSDHYCGYDRFHEENTSSKVEWLRRLDLVEQCSSVNSQVVEELFSSIDKSKHFLTQMKPIHHIFVSRLLMHLSNEKRNRKHMDTIQKKLMKTSLAGCRLIMASDSRVVISAENEVEQEKIKVQLGATNISEQCGSTRISSATSCPNVQADTLTLEETHSVGTALPARLQSDVIQSHDNTSPVVFDIAKTVNRDFVLARHGPYTLTATDFLSLTDNQWLTDEVMDAYIYKVCSLSEAPLLHLPIQTMTRITNGDEQCSMMLRRTKLQNFQLIVGAYLQGGSHWTCLFGIKPAQLSYAGDAAYQRLWKQYMKLKHLLANKPKVTSSDKSKLKAHEDKLQDLRLKDTMKREMTVEIDSQGFIRTGIHSDMTQHGLLVPVLISHLRFHQCLYQLQEHIKYTFKDPILLQLALTHPSYRIKFGTNPDHARNSLTNCGMRQLEYGDRRIHYKHTRKRGINTLFYIMSKLGRGKESLSEISHYERLEFLGDAIVEFLSSIHLFYMFPSLEEGGLTMYRTALVQNQHLTVLAGKLKLQHFMLYAHGPDLCRDSDLRHAMANCFEALIGALFLDGGIDVADRVLSEALFSDDPELFHIWANYPKHPLQMDELDGDRHWITSSAPLQKLVEFEESIGVNFTHIRLLAKAFSMRNVGYNNLTMGHNQRLEFLGDTVLQLITSEYLFKHFPDHHEGHLSLLRSSLVNNRTQAVICTDLDMLKYVIYADRVWKQPADIDSKFKYKDRADLVEALLGALYVDKGLDYCTVFCQVCFYPRLKEFIMNQDWNDPKSQLQQCCLTLRGLDEADPNIPVYKVLESTGPTNTRKYVVGVYFKGRRLATGTGHSIQEAQMLAAGNALKNKARLFPLVKQQKCFLDRKFHKHRREDGQSGRGSEMDDSLPAGYRQHNNDDLDTDSHSGSFKRSRTSHLSRFSSSQPRPPRSRLHVPSPGYQTPRETSNLPPQD